jgi:uncharacterized delta-60 repeat protein
MNTRSIVIAASTAASLVAMEPQARAAPGGIDPTFGHAGRVVTDLAVPGYSGFFPITEAILVQPDGKVLVCGRFWEDTFSYSFGTFIARYLPNGDPDTSFGDQGKVAVIDPGYPYDTWTVGADMALQRDGSILLIGSDTVAEGILVRRYTSSGALDTTFGVDGTAAVPRPSFSRATEGTSIAVQRDGRIVGAGWEFELTEPYYDARILFRMNSDGSMDDSFGPAGTGIVTIPNGYAGGRVLIQPDGGILVAGPLWNLSYDIAPTLLLARYDRDGSPDSDFGDSGIVTDRIEGANTYFSDAALQPDGKIVAVGRIISASGSQSFAVRYNADGSRDARFGTDGFLTVPSSFFDDPRSVVVQPGRRIVVIGNARDEGSGDRGYAALRLTSDGALDAGFGIGGRALHPVIHDGGTLRAVATGGVARHDGRILVAGFFPFDDTIAVIRLDAGPRSGRPRSAAGPLGPAGPEPRPMGVPVRP